MSTSYLTYYGPHAILPASNPVQVVLPYLHHWPLITLHRFPITTTMRPIRLAVLAAALLPSFAQAQQHSHLDDAAIVGIFDAANGWDIATGSLASKNSTRADVKEFGDMLATVHKAVQQQGRDLAKKLG